MAYSRGFNRLVAKLGTSLSDLELCKSVNSESVARLTRVA
jgi:hypothetical protein